MALANERLKKQLRQSKFRELQASSPKASAQLEQVVVTKDDTIRLVQKLYEKHFPKPTSPDLGGGTKSSTSQKNQQDGGIPQDSATPPGKENKGKSVVTFETMKQKLLETIQVDDSE